VLHPEKFKTIPFANVARFLEEHKDYIDGVTITGGEPSMYSSLPELIEKINNLGFKVKLDTNGTNPEMLSALMEGGMLGYVAMDVKAPLQPARYGKLTGVPIDTQMLNKIKHSINDLINSNIDYEFRTTVVPTLLDYEDIVEIARALSGARRYVLQQFRRENAMDSSLREVEPYSKDVFEAMMDGAREFVKTVKLRGV
jgi:pyruvate formate lyase activating enzyme